MGITALIPQNCGEAKEVGICVDGYYSSWYIIDAEPTIITITALPM